MVPVQSRHVAVEGGTVFCEVVGAGRSIVLCHDGMLHRESWDAQFVALSDAHRLVRWDRRGYGRSAAPDTNYSSVDDLARVIDALAEHPAVLIGCSYGSLLCLHCALEHADLVSALVLVGPIVSGLGLTEHFSSRGGRVSTNHSGPKAEIIYWSETDPWLVAPANTGARQRLRDLLTANPHNLEPKGRWQQPPQPAALARLGRITVPTLIIVGEHDIPDVHAHAGAIEAGIGGARRLVLEGAGHLPQLEVPDAFNRTVLEFLSTLP